MKCKFSRIVGSNIKDILTIKKYCKVSIFAIEDQSFIDTVREGDVVHRTKVG